MTPNQRLVRIQRTIADSWRRKIKVIEYDPKERQRVSDLQLRAEEAEARADEWTQNPV